MTYAGQANTCDARICRHTIKRTVKDNAVAGIDFWWSNVRIGAGRDIDAMTIKSILDEAVDDDCIIRAIAQHYAIGNNAVCPIPSEAVKVVILSSNPKHKKVRHWPVGPKRDRIV